MQLEEDKALLNEKWVHMMMIRINEKSSKSCVNLTYLIRNGNMIRHFFMIKRDLFVSAITIKLL